MEAKLKEYRALRRRREILENAKQKIENTKQKIFDFLVPSTSRDMSTQRKEEEFVLLENDESPVEEPLPEKPEYPIQIITDTSETESLPDEKQESWSYFIIKWLVYSIAWITLYLFFLKLQFGAVFFVLSALVGIYLNTRTRPRKIGEVSAYSVFNDNCVSIDGTLKAEQFEREIRYGPSSVR